MNTIRTLSLMAAALTMGLATGAFALYAHAIMPGLKKTDDRTFVTAFQSIDRAIINPWFMLTAFLGALAFTVAALALNVGRDALPWVALALGLYVVAVIITFAVNVPLNDAIKAAGDADPSATRAAFHETRWAAFNVVRTLLSAGASVSLLWALVVHGQSVA
ncbi:anthrone oxygenase family protein [Solirubrobacter soli]|uniref:anthrone oxygenase family protein n=1 Tax=Solirubrobacter soli TaxID=363832 RepID=UPI0003FE44DE|nr:DUF1772 domain-containing protein [Solirubrobacter soli]